MDPSPGCRSGWTDGLSSCPHEPRNGPWFRRDDCSGCRLAPGPPPVLRQLRDGSADHDRWRDRRARLPPSPFIDPSGGAGPRPGVPGSGPSNGAARAPSAAAVPTNVLRIGDRLIVSGSPGRDPGAFRILGRTIASSLGWMALDGRGLPALTRVLIVEDELKVAHALEEGLRQEGYETVIESSGEGAFFRISTERFDVALLDIALPGRDGLEILRALRQRDRETLGADVDGARHARRPDPRSRERRRRLHGEALRIFRAARADPGRPAARAGQ